MSPQTKRVPFFWIYHNLNTVAYSYNLDHVLSDLLLINFVMMTHGLE